MPARRRGSANESTFICKWDRVLSLRTLGGVVFFDILNSKCYVAEWGDAEKPLGATPLEFLSSTIYLHQAK